MWMLNFGNLYHARTLFSILCGVLYIVQNKQDLHVLCITVILKSSTHHNKVHIGVYMYFQDGLQRH